VVLLVGLNSRQGGKLERQFRPTTCAPADLEAAMTYAGMAAGLGDCRRIVEHTSVVRCGNRARTEAMTLAAEEFMRRFLLHVLPSGFHRIRHYGLLANANRKRDIPAVRELLHQPAPPLPADQSTDHTSARPTFVCRHCGAPMLIIDTFARAPHIRGPPAVLSS